jgi:hypothetical protein
VRARADLVLGEDHGQRRAGDRVEQRAVDVLAVAVARGRVHLAPVADGHVRAQRALVGLDHDEARANVRARASMMFLTGRATILHQGVGAAQAGRQRSPENARPLWSLDRTRPIMSVHDCI